MLFISCSKSKDKEMATDETYQMEVLEYKTNIPLPSVKIELYRCSDYDNILVARKNKFLQHDLQIIVAGIHLHKAN